MHLRLVCWRKDKDFVFSGSGKENFTKRMFAPI